MLILKVSNDQLAAPFPRYGGKGRSAPWYLGLLPPHHTYVEPYGGSGAILLAKPPSPVEVLNDLDGDIWNFFCVLRDPALSEQLVAVLEKTPNSRREFQVCQERQAETTDAVERARIFFVLTRQAFGSITGETWAYGRSHAKSFHGPLAQFEPLCRRLQRVQLENLPAVELIARYDSLRTLFVLDPPYLLETRVRQRGYRHEMSEPDHVALLDVLQRVKGKVLLCGYDSQLYNDHLRAWRRVERSELCRTGAISAPRPQRTEIVWMNYEDPRLVG